MSIEVKKYTLPDIYPLMFDEPSSEFFTWVPESRYLILGRSNNAQDSLFIDKVLQDKIEVYQRPSGGEAVILTPNTLVLSAIDIIEGRKNPKEVFKRFNETIIDILSGIGIKKLNQKGISDISIGEKKILGSSMYRLKNKLFYHAVLNVSEPIETIANYLKHPKREPDYRKGRNHSEFVTNLQLEGYGFDVEEIKGRAMLNFE